MNLPAEVLRLLRLRDELNAPDLMINVLDEDACVRWSQDLQSTSVGRRLALYALDDANDSNPYCYIGAGVAAGMVVHFNHDPEPRIEFDSMAAFEAFLRSLRDNGEELGTIDVASPAHPDQTALAAALRELMRDDDADDAEFLLCLYLPLLRGEHSTLLADLGVYDNFFVREALADVIGTGSLPGSDALLQALAADAHPQVRNAAQRAAKALRRRRP